MPPLRGTGERREILQPVREETIRGTGYGNSSGAGGLPAMRGCFDTGGQVLPGVRA